MYSAIAPKVTEFFKKTDDMLPSRLVEPIDRYAQFFLRLMPVVMREFFLQCSPSRLSGILFRRTSSFYNGDYLRLVNKTDLDCPPLILENGHRRAHTPEAELLIEAFISRIRVQNDLLVPRRKLFQFVDDLLAQTYALVIGMDCDITKIRAVDAVGQCAPYADQFLIIKYKALISAI